MSLKDDFRARYGPWAVVTGASSGIGEQFARLLAAEGLNVILVARRTARLDGLADELRQRNGVEVEPLTLDLGQPDFLDSLCRACEGKEIGLVVSNAGVGAKGPHHRVDPDRLAAVVNVNCVAPLLLARSFSPKLIERGRGGFIVTASIESFVAFPYSAAYAASKAFALSFGEAIWRELREYGVDVLVLAPGATDTEILPAQGLDPSSMVGLMKPEDVARQALERLGRGPVYITGALNRVLVGFLRLLPRKIALTVAGKGMQAAIEKGRKP
jgi:short-subunit dehydrogenase